MQKEEGKKGQERLRVMEALHQYAFWLVLLIIMDCLFGIYLWLIDADGFFRLLCALFLGSFGIFAAAVFETYRREKNVSRRSGSFWKTRTASMRHLLFRQYPEACEKS